MGGVTLRGWECKDTLHDYPSKPGSSFVLVVYDLFVTLWGVSIMSAFSTV